MMDGLESAGVAEFCFLLRAAARTAAEVEPEVLAKSANPRNPFGLLIVGLFVIVNPHGTSGFYTTLGGSLCWVVSIFIRNVLK